MENRFGKMGTKPASESFLAECSNLARGESMKDPVHISGCGRGFRMEMSDGRSATTIDREPQGAPLASHAIGPV